MAPSAQRQLSPNPNVSSTSSSSQPPPDPSPPPSGDGHKRKGKGAPRTSRACINCRRQKMKCDGADNPPCKRCIMIGADCSFERRADYMLNPEDLAWQNRVDQKFDTLAEAINGVIGFLRGANPLPQPVNFGDQNSEREHQPMPYTLGSAYYPPVGVSRDQMQLAHLLQPPQMPIPPPAPGMQRSHSSPYAQPPLKSYPMISSMSSPLRGAIPKSSAESTTNQAPATHALDSLAVASSQVPSQPLPLNGSTHAAGSSRTASASPGPSVVAQPTAGSSRTSKRGSPTKARGRGSKRTSSTGPSSRATRQQNQRGVSNEPSTPEPQSSGTVGKSSSLEQLRAMTAEPLVTPAEDEERVLIFKYGKSRERRASYGGEGEHRAKRQRFEESPGLAAGASESTLGLIATASKDDTEAAEEQ